MTHSSEIGFVASALVLVAFGMKDMINLRIVAICSNFVFIAYALVLNLPLVLLLYGILLPPERPALGTGIPRAAQGSQD